MVPVRKAQFRTSPWRIYLAVAAVCGVVFVLISSQLVQIMLKMYERSAQVNADRLMLKEDCMDDRFLHQKRGFHICKEAQERVYQGVLLHTV